MDGQDKSDAVKSAVPEQSAGPKAAAPAARLDAKALSMLAVAVEASADEDGRAHLGQVGSHLAKQSPDFDSRNYGFARLSDLAEASGILEVERIDEQKVVMVKLKKGRRR